MKLMTANLSLNHFLNALNSCAKILLNNHNNLLLFLTYQFVGSLIHNDITAKYSDFVEDSFDVKKGQQMFLLT